MGVAERERGAPLRPKNYPIAFIWPTTWDLAHHALPRAVRLVGQVQPIPATTLAHRLCHLGPIIVFVAVALMGLSQAHAQVRSGGGDHGSALFRGGLSGSADPVRVEGFLT